MDLSEREINMIRGKLSVNHATQEEIDNFLEYVEKLESLLDNSDFDDTFGTEGWRHHIGLD